LVKLSSSAPLAQPAVLEELGKELAMQIAATFPLAIDPSGIAPEILSKEKEIAREQTLAEGKPANIVDKIVEGRMAKYYKDVCLLQQQFVKDSSITVQAHIAAVAKQLQISDLKVASFHRLQLGQ